MPMPTEITLRQWRNGKTGKFAVTYRDWPASAETLVANSFRVAIEAQMAEVAPINLVSTIQTLGQFARWWQERFP